MHHSGVLNGCHCPCNVSLQSLTAVFDDTVFVDCPNLRSLEGLGALGKLGKDLVLRNLPALTSTAGMPNITSVGEEWLLLL